MHDSRLSALLCVPRPRYANHHSYQIVRMARGFSLTMADESRHHKRRRIDEDEESHLSIKPRPSQHGSRQRDVTLRHTHGETSRPRDGFEGPEAGVSAEDAAVLDRDWYNTGEEGGAVLGDDMHNPFGGTEDVTWADQAREQELLEKKMLARQKVNPRFMQRQRDNDAWEANRMLASSVAQTRDTFGGFEDDNEDTRVHLLMHDLKPPFLDGKTVFTKQVDPISAVRDPQSDVAVFARKGSKVVKERRQQKERQKQAQEATNVAGTALGNVMGVKEEDTDSAAPTTASEANATGSKGSRFFKDSEKKKQDTGQSDFSRTKSLREQREYLPAFAVREELLRVVRDNQVTIIVGQTGSGKTTQLTQFLMEDGYAQSGLIGCTQPRRVAAMSVAKRVAEEMEVSLGRTVGYAIRFEDCTSSDTKIKYMTDGVLLRESLTNPDLDQYSCIIMDEAHERALNTDVLMGLIKKVLARRRDLKLIVTSATMNAERFARYVLEFFPFCWRRRKGP